MKRASRRKCLHCKVLFTPEPRSGDRQTHCSQPACRKASKAASQRRWLARPENADYYRGPDNCRRVREWRACHPGYWRQKRCKSASPAGALQGPCDAQRPEDQILTPPDPQPAHLALQGPWNAQPALLVGLIATITGSALQEDIARSARAFFIRGRDILAAAPGTVAIHTDDENQAHPPPRPPAPRAAPV